MIKLFFIFFKIGLFTIGGGLSALPLIQNEAINRNWLTQSEFADIIAISESTPGPIGINISTYVGYEQASLLGAVIATMGMVIPSIIIICIIARYMTRFNENKFVKGAFYAIRPVVVGIILAAAYTIATYSIFNFSNYIDLKSIISVIKIKEFILFIALIILTKKTKFHPILYIFFAGVVGIVFL